MRGPRYRRGHLCRGGGALHPKAGQQASVLLRRNPAALACSEFRHDVGMVLHAMEVDPAAVDLRSGSERLRTTVAARWALRGERTSQAGGRCPWCSPELECPVTLTWARVRLVLMHAASPGAKQVDGIPGMRDRIVGWLVA